MNFKQIQLMEYAMSCIEELSNSVNDADNQIKFKLFFKSSDDIFTASSLKRDQSNKVVLTNIDPTYSFLSKNAKLTHRNYNNDNSYIRVRRIILDNLDRYDISESIIATDPELLIKQISLLIKDIENDFPSESAWYDYESVKYGFKFDYSTDTSDDYELINVRTVVGS